MRLKKSASCLNCGHKIDEYTYCPHCGQLNTHKRLSMRHMLGDFFSDYLTFVFVESVCGSAGSTRQNRIAIIAADESAVVVEGDAYPAVLADHPREGLPSLCTVVVRAMGGGDDSQSSHPYVGPLAAAGGELPRIAVAPSEPAD